jgi:hypothetical protein
MKGAEGIRRFFADVADATPDFTLTIERLEAVGRDQPQPDDGRDHRAW